ncbi:MAG: hypothetical protein ACRD96_26750, partial [Bryobacteraceae bacterium]
MVLSAVWFLLIAQAIEERGEAVWPTKNHYRVRHASAAPAGMPVAVDMKLPADFNPDSMRVRAGAARVGSKVEWRRPAARVSFVSTGAPSYDLYFDTGARGETERLAEPAMVGTGDRITYG